MKDQPIRPRGRRRHVSVRIGTVGPKDIQHSAITQTLKHPTFRNEFSAYVAEIARTRVDPSDAGVLDTQLCGSHSEVSPVGSAQDRHRSRLMKALLFIHYQQLAQETFDHFVANEMVKLQRTKDVLAVIVRPEHHYAEYYADDPSPFFD